MAIENMTLKILYFHYLVKQVLFLDIFSYKTKKNNIFCKLYKHFIINNFIGNNKFSLTKYNFESSNSKLVIIIIMIVYNYLLALFKNI